MFLGLKKFRDISGFKGSTGISLSVGVVFLLSRLFQQSLFKQLLSHLPAGERASGAALGCG